MLEHGRHVSSSLLCRRFLLCSFKSAPEEDASGVEEQQVGVRITDELRNITRAGLLPGMVMRDALMMTLKPPKSLRCGKAKTEMTTSRMKANPKSANKRSYQPRTPVHVQSSTVHPAIRHEKDNRGSCFGDGA